MSDVTVLGAVWLSRAKTRLQEQNRAVDDACIWEISKRRILDSLQEGSYHYAAYCARDLEEHFTRKGNLKDSIDLIDVILACELD